MSETYFSEGKSLDYFFGGISPSAPATWYLGLSTTTPTEAGASITEPSGGGYARTPVANNKTSFSYAVTGSLVNNIEIAFAESSGSWGTVTHMVFFDAITSGCAWFWEALPAPRTVETATTVYYSAGALTISQRNT